MNRFNALSAAIGAVAVGAAMLGGPASARAAPISQAGLTGTPGTVYGWGADSFAQAGTGNAVAQYNTPQSTVLPPGQVAQVQTGGRAGYARLTDGRLLAWGYNIGSALGNGSSLALPFRPVPTPVLGVGGTGALAGVVDVSVHRENTLAAVLSDGTVVTWGANPNGQLGNGTTSTAERPYPERVLTAPGAPLTGVVDVEAGWAGVYALMADGTVTAWGAVKCDGQFAGTTAYATTVPGLSDIRQIAMAGALTLFRRGDGAVLSCGGTDSTIGRSTRQNPYLPYVVDNLGPGSGVVDISIGASTAAALTDDGRIFLWGSNVSNQLSPLGVPSNGGLTVPTALVLPAGQALVVDIELDDSPIVFASTMDGSLLVWGFSTNGMSGLGPLTDLRVSTPTPLVLPTTAFTGVASSNWSVLAVTAPAPDGREHFS